jgi:hypothetical protein
VPRHPRIQALALALAALMLTACVNSSYEPVVSPTAKIVYRSGARRIAVGEREEALGGFSGAYVDLFQGEARESASKSRTNRLVAIITGAVSAGAVVSGFIVADNWADPIDFDTSRGVASFSLLVGGAVIGIVSGVFAGVSEAQLGDAINRHNDEVMAGLSDPQPLGQPVPAPEPEPVPAAAPAPESEPAAAPAPEPAPAPAAASAPEPAPAAAP